MVAARDACDTAPLRSEPAQPADQDAVLALGLEVGDHDGEGLAHDAPAVDREAVLGAERQLGLLIALKGAGLERIAGYVGKVMRYDSVDAAVAATKAAQAAAHPNRDDAFWRRFVRRTARIEADGGVTLDYDPAIANAFANGAAPVDMTTLFEALAKVPVLVVRGGESDLLSREGIDLMRIVKPNLLAVEAPGVGHAPTLEEDESWNAIVDFLAAVD